MPISGVSSGTPDYLTQQLQAAQQTQQVQSASADKDHDNDQGSEAAEGLGRFIDVKG